MAEPYPPIEPYDQVMLDVGDGNLVYWETCGNPDGKPALTVHGGPGSGCSTGMRRVDPDRYGAVLFDQRGCGRSTPHVSDPATDMSANTTEHLLSDMELLREHLGINRWLLSGGSWGSTLALAYAERHPHRVSEIVLSGVTTTRRSEIDWLYRGVARFFPEEWAVPGRCPRGRPRPRRRLRAPDGRPRPAGAGPGRERLVCVRLDLSGPLDTAWELARAWPDAELVAVRDAGHQGSDTTRERMRSALDGFARQ